MIWVTRHATGHLEGLNERKGAKIIDLFRCHTCKYCKINKLRNLFQGNCRNGALLQVTKREGKKAKNVGSIARNCGERRSGV